MKAKEILNLCEVETLSTPEITSFLSSYFVKKMKTIGAKIDNLGGSSFLGASIVIGFSEDFDDAIADARKYLKKISRAVVSQKITERDFELLLPICLPKRQKQPMTRSTLFGKDFTDPFLVLICSVFPTPVNSSEPSFRVSLYIKSSYLIEDEIHANTLKYYPQFATEKSLLEVKRVIDSVVKVIRLTPFGG